MGIHRGFPARGSLVECQPSSIAGAPILHLKSEKQSPRNSDGDEGGGGGGSGGGDGDEGREVEVEMEEEVEVEMKEEVEMEMKEEVEVEKERSEDEGGNRNGFFLKLPREGDQ